MNKEFLTLYIGTIVRPKATFVSLIENPKNIPKGLIAVFIPATLYTLVYVFLIFGGGRPSKPWLTIPPETYYRYNVFFCAPSMILGWILAAGVVHALSRIVATRGTFEQTLTVFGFGLSIATWTTGIHDLATSLLGAIHRINQHEYEIALNAPTVWRTLLWIQMAAYLIWFVVLFSKAVNGLRFYG